MLVSPIRCAMVCLFTIVLAPKAPAQSENTTQRWVLQLGDQSYAARLRARSEIESIGPSKAMIQTLRAGARSASVEIQASCQRLLSHFEHRQFKKQIDQLLDPSVLAGEIDVNGWQHFSSICGEQMSARRLFAKIAETHPVQLQNLSRKENSNLQTKEIIASKPDSIRLRSDDFVNWSATLFL